MEPGQTMVLEVRQQVLVMGALLPLEKERGLLVQDPVRDILLAAALSPAKWNWKPRMMT
jgi:hypothetical protein